MTKKNTLIVWGSPDNSPRALRNEKIVETYDDAIDFMKAELWIPNVIIGCPYVCRSWFASADDFVNSVLSDLKRERMTYTKDFRGPFRFIELPEDPVYGKRYTDARMNILVKRINEIGVKRNESRSGI